MIQYAAVGKLSSTMFYLKAYWTKPKTLKAKAGPCAFCCNTLAFQRKYALRHGGRPRALLWKARKSAAFQSGQAKRAVRRPLRIEVSAAIGFEGRSLYEQQKRYYDYVCEQIYHFFTRRGYEEENLTAAAFREMFITTTAVTISQQTGVDAALVTAAVTLVVSTTLKVGVRAWCQYYADRHPEMRE